MPLEAEPTIIDPPAQKVLPKHSTAPSGGMLPKHHPLKKKDKATSSAMPKSPSKRRSKEKEASHKPKAVEKDTAQDKKRSRSRKPVPTPARTSVTISAKRKRLSLSPVKKARFPLIPEEEESDTDPALDPTLDAAGNPTRPLPLKDIPPEQSTEFVGDEDYPKLTPIAVKLRALERDIQRTIRGRDDFAHFEDDDIIETAQFFWDCGLTSTVDLKKTRTLNRNYMLEDLRRAGASAKSLGLFTALLNLFPPPVQAQQGRKGGFVECCIPRLLPDFSANLSGLASGLVPNQPMVNDISRQLAEGELCHPAYTAFPTAHLQDEPWKPDLSTHDRAAEDWKKRMTGLRSSQSISFQAYVLYSLRFIFSAHMVSAWEPFGGISAQLNALAVMLNISVVEHGGIAIDYDIAIRKHCAALARQRRSDIDYAHLLSHENPEIRKQVLANRSSGSADDAAGKKVKGKGKGKGKKGKDRSNRFDYSKTDTARNDHSRSDNTRRYSRSRRRSRSKKRSRSRNRSSPQRGQKQQPPQKKKKTDTK